MAKRAVTGTTKQSARTTIEKKQKKENPPRMTEAEKNEKYGKKNFFLNYKINFKAKNEKQQELFDMIHEKQITICTGEAGTGKSFSCLSAALKLLNEDNTYKRIIIVVPTIESGSMPLGFLPGSMEDKIFPYLESHYFTIAKILNLSHNNGESCLNYLLENKIIIGQPISFMKGKTIDETILIIEESEDFSKQELFLLLSRISDSSKYILNGDNKQVYRKDLKKEPNGLEYAEKVLKDKLDEVGLCHFGKEHIVRSKVISKIMNLWFPEEA